MTPPIDYVRIDNEILTRKDLSSTEKIVLGLIKNFNAKGLRLPNSEIAKLVGTKPKTVTIILSRLQDKGWIRIENSQSKYRQVYFRTESEVKPGLLPNKVGSKKNSTSDSNIPTSENNIPTSEKNRTITKQRKKTKERRAPQKKKPRVGKFVKPTPNEVTEYASSIGFNLDVPYWFDHYDSNGWKVGRNPMRDWKATVRQWKRRDERKKQTGTPSQPDDLGGCVMTAPMDPDEANKLLREIGYYKTPVEIEAKFEGVPG